jgi:hypothetical protein
LIDYCEENLVTENQPSIRLIMEWVLIKIFATKSYKYDMELFWHKLDSFTNKKVGYTSSWVSLLTNLAPIVSDNDSIKICFLQNLLPLILSQILSSNFHIRTYVEASLIKLHLLITQPYPDVKNGLNHLQNDPQIKALIRQIYSIIQPILNE